MRLQAILQGLLAPLLAPLAVLLSSPIAPLLLTSALTQARAQTSQVRLLVSLARGNCSVLTHEANDAVGVSETVLTSPEAPLHTILLVCPASIDCETHARAVYGKQVVAVEEDAELHAVPFDSQVSIDGFDASANPPWNLDRIDGKLDGVFHRTAHDGSGVDVYMIDTGVRGTHSEFTGRVKKGRSFVDLGDGNTDCNGHGTHTASVATGKTFGVATGATVVPVKVLNCNGNGFTSGVIQGIMHAADAAGSRIMSLSLGGPATIALDNAIAYAETKGVVAVVAAGNENWDACSSSPARAPWAVTVAATTIADVRSSYSNYGNCVDLFAPGTSVIGAYYTSDTASIVLSGTSMATPHVTGVLATMMQRWPGESAKVLLQRLLDWAERDTISNSRTTPTLFLNNDGIQLPTKAPTRPPVPRGPTPRPTKAPTPRPTKKPSPAPTPRPTKPTRRPSPAPTLFPTAAPTLPVCNPNVCRCPNSGAEVPVIQCGSVKSQVACMVFYPQCNWAVLKKKCYKL